MIVVDYALYWLWCLFVYSLICKLFRGIEIKKTFTSESDAIGMGFVSLIAYMIIMWGSSEYIYLGQIT